MATKRKSKPASAKSTRAKRSLKLVSTGPKSKSKSAAKPKAKKVGVAKSTAAKTTAKTTAKKKAKVATAKAVTAKSPAKKKAASPKTKTTKKSVSKKEAATKDKKQINDRLLNVLENRTNKYPTAAELFSKPAPTRRGRRPKNSSEYIASTDADGNQQEGENENIEYDTGIKASFSVDRDVPTYERSDDFEEELNFDW